LLRLVCVVLAVEMVAVAIAVHTYALAGKAVVCSAVFGCGRLYTKVVVVGFAPQARLHATALRQA
jgi:hypothetical protein